MFYHLKSAGVDQVLRALKAGGTLDAMSGKGELVEEGNESL